MSAGIIAASVAAPIIGGLLGQEASRGDKASQNRMLNRAMTEIMGAMPPNPEDQKIFLEELKRQGVLTPELEETVLLQGTAFDNVSTDPRLKQAQMSALSSLQDVSEDGYTIEDKAALSRIQSDNAAVERGQREAILGNARARGVAGSGMELAAQLQTQQSAANRNAQGGLDVAAQAQRRALEAMMAAGQMSGEMRGQDFGEQSRVAQARDSIAQFNANQRQGVVGRNTNRGNEAQMYNLGEDQRLADANSGRRNEQQVYNKEVNNRAYEQDLSKRQAAAGVYGAKSDAYGQKAAETRQMWGKVGQGVGMGAAAYGAYDAKKGTK